MDSPSFTQDNLNLLDEAIAQGAFMVRYADKTIQYRNLSEMLQIRRLMKAEINPPRSGSGRSFACFSKGVE